METLKLSRKDFDASLRYIHNTLNYEGHVKIEANLGVVFFQSLSVKGYILAEAGSGIKAGEGIEAGSGIKVMEI